MLILVKIFLTVATLGYSAIPAFFDSNDTHATNPAWTGHARYHVVWQVSSYVYIGLLMLTLIWTAGDNATPLWIAAIMSACIYAGFWTAFFSRPVYGGWLVDKTNPVPAFHWNLFGLKFETDANVTLFLPAVIIVAISFLLLLQLS